MPSEAEDIRLEAKKAFNRLHSTCVCNVQNCEEETPKARGEEHCKEGKGKLEVREDP